MTNSSAITVVRTSDRGAKLITDGVRQTWIQGRWMRPDGTLTAAGQAALETAPTIEEVEQRAKEREEARAKAREEGAKMECRDYRNSDNPIYRVGETEKAYKIWRGNYIRLYGRVVRSYIYWPKSLVHMIWNAEGQVTTVAAPRWWMQANLIGWGEKTPGDAVSIVDNGKVYRIEA